MDADVLNSSIYPYKPDIIMGYKGNKVGVFVLSEINTTRDTQKADGSHRFRMRVLENAHKKHSGSSAPIKTTALAVDHIVKYDIENFKLDLNQDFNFIQVLDQVVPKTSSIQTPDFSGFSAFGSQLISQAASYIEKLPDHSKEV